MWSSCENKRKKEIEVEVFDLMSNHVKFCDAMLLVISEWPNSTAASLTNPSVNHRAWVGAAACALQVESPEELTRKVWGTLTEEQQDLANSAADSVISIWQEMYYKDNDE